MPQPAPLHPPDKAMTTVLSVGRLSGGAASADAQQMLAVLKNILNGMDAYVYVSNLDTDEILFINRRMRAAFGLDESVVGQICWKVLQNGFTERCPFCPNRRLAIDPDTPVVWEEHNTVTGRYYRNVDSIIEWTDGQRVHMQHSIDITDIVAAQNETQAIRDRLEIALAASQAGVWELAFDNDRLGYDDTCGRLFGFPADRHAINVPELVAHLERTVRNPDGIEMIGHLRARDPYAQNLSRDFHLAFPDGTERHVRNYGHTIRDAGGKALRVIGMCMDISQHVTLENELKAAKEGAENASRAKSQFLSNMSHEIRTPMNAIIGMTDILIEENLTDRQRHYMKDIRVSATALLSIINDILDFSKIEAGKLQLVPVDYDIMQMLENIESMFSFSAAGKGIYFYLDIQNKLPPCLHGDDIRLRQALINVIGNAVKFTSRGGVTLVVRADGDRLRFDVSDTGVGMTPEGLGQIFKDFGQIDTRNNRRLAGTGLGLSITKSLIGIMNGRIWVESEYGKGSVFHIEVPLVEGDASQLAVPGEDPGFVSAPDAQVLVVDDNEVNLNVAGGLLRMFGIACDTAGSGREALERIAAKKYDLVFMDHMMPDMDGVETTREIRKTHSPEEQVVVALTANAVEGARETLLAAHMNDYLSKPIDRAKLNQILRRWLPPEKVRLRSGPPPEPEADAAPSPLVERVAAIEGVDVKLGLERIGGMRDVYEKSLAIMTRRLPEVISRLDAFVAAGDLKGYAIEVHGAKGSLNNIGATLLGRAAEALEHKAKAGDLAFCRDKNPILAGALARLHGELSTAVAAAEAEAPPAPPGDRAELVREFPLLREALIAFESDEALDRLRPLCGRDYGPEWNGALKRMLQAIEEFDYDGALAVLDKLTAAE